MKNTVAKILKTERHALITASFKNHADVEAVLHRLKMMGVTEKQIGVVMSDETHGKHFRIENHSKVDQGIAAGATFGGIVGGILAAIVGGGILPVPGLNLILAGGVVSALAGGGVGAATGGLIGGLIGLGIPEHEAKLYEGKLRSGGILLAVEAANSEQADKIRKVL